MRGACKDVVTLRHLLVTYYKPVPLSRGQEVVVILVLQKLQEGNGIDCRSLRMYQIDFALLQRRVHLAKQDIDLRLPKTPTLM